VSFARLAAFGLTHAALGLVVWDGTTALWGAGGLLVVAAVALFVVGNAVAFALEGLVAGVQALRLEYYELFSRVFTAEGRPFRPWHVAVDPSYSSSPTRGSYP
jgi:V/A-type H+-transporting ATPase subunit I